MLKVFINPGHAPGVDPGAVNPRYGITEADIAGKVGRKVAKYLTSLGCEARVLQSDNLCGESPAYPNVCSEANVWGADIFISIHCNASGIGVARGTECFTYNGYGRARELAEKIQGKLVKTLGTADRGCKVRKDLAVLQCTTMPAVLVELAFMDNDADFELLMHRQDDMAYAIVEGVKEYFML